MSENNATGRIFKIRYDFNSPNDKMDYYSAVIDRGLSHESISKWVFIFVPFSETCPTPFIDVFIKFDVNKPISRIKNWFLFGKITKLAGKDVFFRSIVEVLNNNYDTEGVRLIESESCRNGLLLNSNFDCFPEIVDYLKREAKRSLKYGVDSKSDYERVKLEIFNNGMILKDCQSQYKELYEANKIEFESLRLGYIVTNSSGFHRNYYIYSNDPYVISCYLKELIHSLLPNCNSRTPVEYLDNFTFDFEGNNFLGYDGQPVVVYEFKDNGKCFTNISEIVDSGYSGDYDKFFEGFGGKGVSGEFNIIVSNLSFEDFISGVPEDVKQRLYDLFPLPNVVYVSYDFIRGYVKRNPVKKDTKDTGGLPEDFKIEII